jgi:predicted ATP-dependent endonuclease of OLD family
MIIKHFKVTHLNQNPSSNFELQFNQDINVLTGKNGAGKTTILKLIWYLISGNIDRMMTEGAIFKDIAIETNTFSLKIKIADLISFQWNIGKGEQHHSVEAYKENGFFQFLNQEILKVSDTSIFFPTFRRMEGGFFTSERQGHIYHALEKGVDNLSKDLSVRQHQFITSISTDDIINFITRQYADVSEKNNEIQKQLARFIKELTTEKNALHDIIFIDEPELSLHVDWQRTLFDTLMEQGTENQFFIATHSPFIYSQFPDKEIINFFNFLLMLKISLPLFFLLGYCLIKTNYLNVEFFFYSVFFGKILIHGIKRLGVEISFSTLIAYLSIYVFNDI